MAISIEHGIHKIVFLVLSIIFIFLGAYPFLISNTPTLKFFDESYLSYIIIVFAVIQLFYVIKSFKKSRIYRSF